MRPKQSNRKDQIVGEIVVGDFESPFSRMHEIPKNVNNKSWKIWNYVISTWWYQKKKKKKGIRGKENKKEKKAKKEPV